MTIKELIEDMKEDKVVLVVTIALVLTAIMTVVVIVLALTGNIITTDNNTNIVPIVTPIVHLILIV